MNNKRLILILALATGLFASCTKDLKMYNGKDNLYFLYAITARQGGAALTDKTDISLGFSPETVKDSIVNIPVQIMGVVSNNSRSYTVNVGAASTAKTGTHFEFVNTAFTIDPGQTRDTIQVRFKRTAEMKDTTLKLVLELAENEHFSMGMNDKLLNVGTSEKLSFVTHTISINDQVRRPLRWNDSYLGEFTIKKMFLLSEKLNILPAYLDIMSIPELTYYGRFMQRYLNDERGNGRIVYEANGTTEMVMGPLSQ